VHKSARFWSVLDFDREYPGKAVNGLIKPAVSLASDKKLLNFGPLKTTVMVRMLTHSKSTMRVLCTRGV